MQKKWKELPKAHIIVAIVSIILSALVVIFAMLQLFRVWDRALNICVPMLGVVNLCQAYLHWKTSRKAAYFCIGTAIFIFICSVIVFFI